MNVRKLLVDFKPLMKNQHNMTLNQMIEDFPNENKNENGIISDMDDGDSHFFDCKEIKEDIIDLKSCMSCIEKKLSLPEN